MKIKELKVLATKMGIKFSSNAAASKVQGLIDVKLAELNAGLKLKEPVLTVKREDETPSIKEGVTVLVVGTPTSHYKGIHPITGKPVL